MVVHTNRIYDEQSAKKQTFRVLVDRLWPRGISKEKAHIDLWAKDIAPSSELRTWFGHRPERFKEFQSRYEEELEQNKEFPVFLDNIRKHSDITILYGAKDPLFNQAVVLQKFLESRLNKAKTI